MLPVSHHSAPENHIDESVGAELAFDCGSPIEKSSHLLKCMAGKQIRFWSSDNDLVFSDKGNTAVPPASVEVD